MYHIRPRTLRLFLKPYDVKVGIGDHEVRQLALHMYSASRLDLARLLIPRSCLEPAVSQLFIYACEHIRAHPGELACVLCVVPVDCTGNRCIINDRHIGYIRVEHTCCVQALESVLYDLFGRQSNIPGILCGALHLHWC